MTFRITFTDGFFHDFAYDSDVSQGLGNRYQKYEYLDLTPDESLPLSSDYYEFVETTAAPVPAMSVPSLWILGLIASGLGLILIRNRPASC